MAVNVDRPNGFRPVRHINGSPWNGVLRPYNIAASNSAIFYGDCVLLTAAGEVNVLAAGNTSGNFLGVALGFGRDRTDMGDSAVFDAPAPYDPLNLDVNFVAATTTGVTVWVCDDPWTIFEAQEDGASDPLDSADVGAIVDIIATHSGSTTTGVSGQEIDSEPTGVVYTDPWQIYGPVDRPDNSVNVAATPNARWLVKPNAHIWKPTVIGGATPTAGIDT